MAKNLSLKKEGSWVELQKVELTEEQKTLLKSTDEKDKEARKDLMTTIKEQREKKATKADIDKVQPVYDKYKPELKETDKYQLIGCNATIADNGSIRGIINCRVNGDHKQIRFNEKPKK